ncbi:MAG: hypothetical protein ACMUIL_12165 [bacterium]
MDSLEPVLVKEMWMMGAGKIDGRWFLVNEVRLMGAEKTYGDW